MSRSNIPALDGLRGFAALLVVVSHFAGAEKIAGGYLQFGKIGVMLFFSLSGFLMAYLYLDVKRAATKSDILQYCARRFARVYPLFFMVVIASYFFNTYASPRLQNFVFKINNENFLAHLLLQDGVSVLWTISVEFVFYAAFIPVMILWKKHREVLVAHFILILFINGILGYPGTISDSGARFWFGYSSFFITGLICGQLFKLSEHLNLKPISFDVMFIYCCLAIPFMTPAAFSSLFPSDESWLQNEMYVLLCGAFTLSASRSRIAAKVFGNIIGIWVGAISYSIYLLHIPILRILRILTDIEENDILYFFVFTSIVLLISSMSYLYFEKPMMKLINRLADRQIRRYIAAPI